MQFASANDVQTSCRICKRLKRAFNHTALFKLNLECPLQGS